MAEEPEDQAEIDGLRISNQGDGPVGEADRGNGE